MRSCSPSSRLRGVLGRELDEVQWQGGRGASAMGLVTPPALGGAAVHQNTLALLIDHPKATARQRREGCGVVGHSWHATRIRTDGMGMTALAIHDRRQGRTGEECLV